MLLYQAQREWAYNNEQYKQDGTPLITWNEDPLTIDKANQLYLAYDIEDDPRAAQLKALIVSAKAYIRDLYPYVG